MKLPGNSTLGRARPNRRDDASADRAGIRATLAEGWFSLAAEGRLLGRWMRERFFLLGMGLLLVLYTLALQLPVHLDLNVGASAAVQPEQPNSFVHLVGKAFDEPVGRPYDQVFLQEVYPAEQGGDFTFRWTEPQAALVYHGLPRAPVVVRLRMHGAVEGAVTTTRLRVAGRNLAAFPVVYPLHHYAFVVDPALWAGDTLRLELESAAFVPGEQDPRQLGLAVDRVVLYSERRGWRPAVPWTALLLTGTAASLYLALRRAGCTAPAAKRNCLPVRRDRWSLIAAAGGALWGGIVLLALLLPSRPVVTAYARGLFLAAALSYPLLLVTLAAARALFRRAGLWPDRRTWICLALLFLAAFLARFGGALSPRYLSHDGPFHANRLKFAEQGKLFFVHQSIEAGMRSDPYPAGLYLTLAPLAVLVTDADALLALALAWVGAGEVFLVWFLARQVLGARAGRWAALLYGAFPIALSAFWFGIYANLFANGVVLLLAVNLVLAYQGRGSTSPLHWVPLWALFLLAHFGMVLLWGPLLLLWGGLLYWRGGRLRRQRVRRLLLSGAAALLLVTALYYSHFYAFFGNMSAALGAVFTPAREAATENFAWSRTLAEARVWWRWGFVADYAGVGVPLGLLGLGLLGRPYRRGAVALWMGALIGVAVFFWAISMVTGYFARYMLFLLPVAAIGSAEVLALCWERGRAGRVVAGGLLAYICGMTAVLWLGLCLWGWHPPHVL